MSERKTADDTEVSNASGMTIVSYLLGGLAFWGFLGWLADRAFGFETLFLPIGLLLGLVGAMYLIITQYVRS
ncbi:AtpZ/AtpI family protein [Nocardiopsis coralliicola]